jgi:hypothetical protein
MLEATAVEDDICVVIRIALGRLGTQTTSSILPLLVLQHGIKNVLRPPTFFFRESPRPPQKLYQFLLLCPGAAHG